MSAVETDNTIMNGSAKCLYSLTVNNKANRSPTIREPNTKINESLSIT
ncbi:MAG: hypothetical protein SFU98_17465 [Leptospiraceae bacterium]|nr:hypothetical protein [Leptospiraceae bacterium]